MFEKLKKMISIQARYLKKEGLKNTLLFDKLMFNTMNDANKNIKNYYKKLKYNDLIKTKKSNRVFIFGSGYSLNDLKQEEWSYFNEYDTIGFNAFVYQKWIHVDYHLIRGWAEGSHASANWEYLTDDYKSIVSNNRFYDNTIFIYQDDLTAQFSHSLFKYKALLEKTKIFPYKTNYEPGLPARNYNKGLKHTIGTLCDAIHFAYCLGWKEIILVGVDLYDTRYFWLKSDETFSIDYKTGKRKFGEIGVRGQKYYEKHSTATNGIIELIDKWNKYFLKNNTKLFVYNPKSLLNTVLPIYKIK